ncbi:MAG: glycosyltransferase family 4 protein [Pyrinomonadaceae bacterium]
MADVSLDQGGIGPYALRVLTSLLTDFEQGWEFVLVCATGVPERLKPLIASLTGAVEVRIIPFAAEPGTPAEEHWGYLKRWLDQLDLDLLHFPTQTPLHPDLQVPYSLTVHEVRELPHLNLEIPFIVTMHDVQELHFPENFTPQQRAIRSVQYWKTLERARKVVVSFNHIKDDLTKYFGLPEEKIHVCPIPFRAISLQQPTSEAIRSYLEKYAGWNPFLLYPSHTWRHKNHLQLLRALQQVRQRTGGNLRLICTGGTNHHYHAQVLAQVAALGLNKAVLFTGIVAEDELQWLYHQAALVTIPTKYEAGSFPLFEAMIEGAPVICSNVTSLPATIGDQRFVFDPQDVAALSDLIIRVISDEPLRQANFANSAEQANRLFGVNAAAFFYETYRSALNLPTSKETSDEPEPPGRYRVD